MASGIAVSDACVDAYKALSKRSYSVVVLKIDDSMTEVQVEKKIPPMKDPESDWKAFTKSLPEKDCRFVIADFVWKDTPTVEKSKICMLLWSPEYAPIRSKMIYASSQEAVANKASVQRTIQATERDELAYKTIKDQVAK
eukprot:Plantae.Rhodophyta-Hildenbrandia_rubra.ctg6695.p1 GENE.Plantae.Rhodophyta-Hildenbrandia_rubra.ctg6695~~Plantae.Rhodophyta-Hildenbrandia_rubra.ctg6695.p1  ORF type:complete len:140 (+),score=24.57 Plantae.Rhodophyta-Hildenbrandia_rubra.ctg6695:199-618(+)